MLPLLNLLAAIALLVWGTHIVRTGMLRVFGENLRRILALSFGNRFRALIAGLGVRSLVQSSTATCLIVASFVGKNLVTTSAALAVMLGADVGTSVMAVVFSLDLSWLSPLLIVVLPQVHVLLQQLLPSVHQQVVGFHLAFNLVLAALFIACTGLVGRTVDRWLSDPHPGAGSLRPRHLDPLALNMPSLAISCAA